MKAFIDRIIVGAILLGLAYAMPRLALVFIALAVLYFGFRWYQESPALARSRAARKAKDLYRAAMRLSASQGLPDTDTFQAKVWKRVTQQLGDIYPTLSIVAGFPSVIRAVYEGERLGQIPEPPEDATTLDYARYCDDTSALIKKLGAPGLAESAVNAVTQALVGFTRQLPSMALQSKDAHQKAMAQGPADMEFSIRLLDTLPNPGGAVQAFAMPFFSAEAVAYGLFGRVRDQLNRNAFAMSGVPYPPAEGASPKVTNPQDHKGTADEVAAGYLRHTPFLDLLARDIPFEISDSARFEHHWIVAGSGHGKTQTLQYLIAKDLERVAILEQARKFNVGMVLAHQYVGQLSPKLQESFSANTSIKFAGGVSDKDARTLAHMLRCSPEFILDQTKGHFAASVRGLTTGAVSLEVPFGHLEAMPRMTEAEADNVLASMRDHYAVFWEEMGRTAPSAAEDVGPVVNVVQVPVSTEPAKEW